MTRTPTAFRAIEPLERRTLFSVPGGGIEETVVGDGLDRPTAISIPQNAGAPVLIAERGGRVRQFRGGTLVRDAGAPLTDVDATGEFGLLGLAASRNFGGDRVVYVNYTASTPAPHQRVSRFTLGGTGLVLANERVLLDLPAWANGAGATNLGGAVHVAYDGTLMVGVGDGGKKELAADPNSPFGKVLRLRPDGSVPANNPRAGADGWQRFVWASGLRNPAYFSVHPDNGLVYLNDQGEAAFEEINVGQAGANYGWPGVEGGKPSSPGAVIQGPVYAYPHAAGDAGAATNAGAVVGSEITGGLWFQAGTLAFPRPYGGDYFFADRSNGTIRALDVDAAQPTGKTAVIAADVPAPVDLAFTAEGVLFCVAGGSGGSDGRLIRYASTGGPAVITPPADATVRPGRVAVFTVEAAGLGALTYQWQRAGVDIPGATADTYTLGVAVADDGASFTVRVRNPAGEVVSAAAVLHVTPDGGGADPGTVPPPGGGGGTPTSPPPPPGGPYPSPFKPPKPPPPPMGPIDLQPVVSAALPAAVVGGSGAAARATVRVYNLGLDTARGPLKLQLRFSTDVAASADDLPAGEVDATIKIKPGSSRTFRAKVDYPDATGGTYYLVAEVDPLDVLPETNEANNVAASGSAVRVSGAFVDVRTRLGPTPAAVAAGGTAVAAVAVYNDGNVAADGAMTVLVWAVPPGTPAAEAPAVGTAVYAGPAKLALAPGRGRTVRLKFALPADLPAGLYDLVASVDPGVGLTELDAANNASAGATALTVG